MQKKPVALFALDIISMVLLAVAAYLALFSAIFYYGLKWLDMLNNRRQKSVFLGTISEGVYWSRSCL